MKILGCLVGAAALALPFAQASDTPSAASGSLTRHGVVVDFEARPVETDLAGLTEGELAEIRFRLSEEATGAPVSGITPGAWLDMGHVIQGKPEQEQKSCKDKIALYLKGVVGMRPMLDLNSYYIFVMNREGTVSIIDPLVSMVGKTSTLGMLRLNGPGTDWAKSREETRLFVSIPSTGDLAVIDTEAFTIEKQLAVGDAPTRVLVQPDGRYVWVGNNSTDAAKSGVTVVSTRTLEVVASIPTGLGHHEIAFSTDNRHAFVSNRDSGTVSVIDVQTLEKKADLETGPMPISVAYSALSESLYVADGRVGVVAVVNNDSLEVVQQIQLETGLGPLKFAPGDRYALAVNPSRDKVFVIAVTVLVRVHHADGLPVRQVR